MRSVPPALIVLADDPEHGVPGLTDDPAVADALLSASLDLARQVPGVGRVLLFHPAEAEGRLAAKALGFRLWPQEGGTEGERYANAFRQAADLGYEGAVVIGLTVPTLPADRIAEAVTLLEQHHGAIAGDGRGGIALLALQEPQPTILSDDGRPSADDVRTRAAQQLVRLVELPDHPSLASDTLDDYLTSTAS